MLFLGHDVNGGEVLLLTKMELVSDVSEIVSVMRDAEPLVLIRPQAAHSRDSRAHSSRILRTA